jgi:hypothetical protein
VLLVVRADDEQITYHRRGGGAFILSDYRDRLFCWVNFVHMVFISSSESEKNGAQQKAEPNVTIDTNEQDVTNFPMAVKMMFNYDTESNATSILRAMYRETVPAQCHFTNEELSCWEKR